MAFTPRPPGEHYCCEKLTSLSAVVSADEPRVHCQTFFLFFFFPCSADHEQRDWPPWNKVVFFGLVTNALNVRNNNNNNNTSVGAS